MTNARCTWVFHTKFNPMKREKISTIFAHTLIHTDFKVYFWKNIFKKSIFCLLCNPSQKLPELAKLRVLPNSLPRICQFFTLWHFATLDLQCLFLFCWAVVPFCHQLYPGLSSAGNLTIGKLQYNYCQIQLICHLVFIMVCGLWFVSWCGLWFWNVRTNTKDIAAYIYGQVGFAQARKPRSYAVRNFDRPTD